MKLAILIASGSLSPPARLPCLRRAQPDRRAPARTVTVDVGTGDKARRANQAHQAPRPTGPRRPGRSTRPGGDFTCAHRLQPRLPRHQPPRQAKSASSPAWRTTNAQRLRTPQRRPRLGRTHAEPPQSLLEAKPEQQQAVTSSSSPPSSACHDGSYCPINARPAMVKLCKTYLEPMRPSSGYALVLSRIPTRELQPSHRWSPPQPAHLRA